MTTLWARELIFKAAENGQISDAAAQYFDHMIDMRRFKDIKHSISVDTNNYEFTTQEEVKYFNGSDLNCVLGRLGEINKQYKSGHVRTEFGLYQYITLTSFPSVKGDGSLYYMANILGQDFIGLDGYIRDELAKNKLSAEKWIKVKDYLENTYEICAKNDIGRKDYVPQLIKMVDARIKQLNINEEYQELSAEEDRLYKEATQHSFF